MTRLARPPRPTRRSRTARPSWVVFGALVLASATACDSGPDPGPGTLTATVVSPNGAEGAAVLSVFGDGLQGVSAVQGRAFGELDGDTLRVVVVGDGGTLRFGLQVADTTRKPTGVVVEVAGPDDELRPSVAGYSVEFVR